MDFVECKDPIFLKSPLDEYAHEFPSNTYYPPGVLCAKERDEYLCPTSGESGSPLMSRANKLTTEGILSFVKGCTRFAFGKYQAFLDEELSAQFNIDNTDTRADVVIQDSDNPLVYTKLYCYLPWIAQQYGLEYDGTISDDPDCFFGSGDGDVYGYYGMYSQYFARDSFGFGIKYPPVYGFLGCWDDYERCCTEGCCRCRSGCWRKAQDGYRYMPAGPGAIGIKCGNCQGEPWGDSGRMGMVCVQWKS